MGISHYSDWSATVLFHAKSASMGGGNEKKNWFYDKQALMLTVEELDVYDNLRSLSPEMKLNTTKKNI